MIPQCLRLSVTPEIPPFRSSPCGGDRTGAIPPRTREREIVRTKIDEMVRLFDQLRDMGFTLEEAQALRRIEMTLHRWSELECGDGNDYASWAIERDEETQKPYRVTYPHTGKSYRTRVADKEAGALKRLAKIVEARNARLPDAPVLPYHQGDPSGCSLYIVRASDVPNGESLACWYTRGVAVAA